MRLASSIPISIAALVLSASTVWAEPVPDRASGVWSVGGCSGDAFTVLVTSSSAIALEEREGKAVTAVAKAEWANGTIVLTMEGKGNEWVLPPLNALRKCDALPGVLPLLFAETIAIFGQLDEIDAACKGENGVTARCVALVFDIVDLTGDGKFSRAEISRAVRAAGFFIGYRMVADKRQDPFVPLDELYLAQIAATALGPLVATNLIESYDFDGDGFVSFAELLQDRRPEKGLEGALATVASGMAPEALAAAMKSVTGILGMFQ